MHQQQTTIANGTVFGLWPLSRSVPAVAALIVTLFVAIKPEASLGLGVLERIVFWTLHVGVALAALLIASALLLPRFMARLPLWVALLLAGAAASLGMVPVFFLLESAVPEWLQAVEEEPIDVFGAQGLWQALLVEAAQAAPVMLLMWMIINLPLLAGAWRRREGAQAVPSEQARGDAGEGQEQSTLAAEMAGEARREFLERLPRSIGTEVLLVSSDLHYLHVFTHDGKCMILGTLREVSEALGDEGVMVHRSHWVARTAVERIIKDRGRWFLALRNGVRVPVSRRRQAEVGRWFGAGARVVSLARRQEDSAAE